MKQRKHQPPPPPLMSHEDRVRLIHAPIRFQVYGGHCWGGTFIDHDIPVEGKRSVVYHPEDEAYLRYGKGEDE